MKRNEMGSLRLCRLNSHLLTGLSGVFQKEDVQPCVLACLLACFAYRQQAGERGEHKDHMQAQMQTQRTLGTKEKEK